MKQTDTVRSNQQVQINLTKKLGERGCAHILHTICVWDTVHIHIYESVLAPKAQFFLYIEQSRWMNPYLFEKNKRLTHSGGKVAFYQNMNNKLIDLNFT